jgi:hypothetical protein
MAMTDDRDWREWAHLHTEHWPEAIPWTGPRREYGVYPWCEPTHDQYGVDDYPQCHPDAASIGYDYRGDVCPMCGVPLPMTEDVVTKVGNRGKLADVSPDGHPVPSYHPACYEERQETLQAKQLEVSQ